MAIPFLNTAYFSTKVGIGTDSPATLLQVGVPVGNSPQPTAADPQGARIYSYDGALSLFTNKLAETPFTPALSLYNNPSSGGGTGTGIEFRARVGAGGGWEFTPGLLQGDIYTAWTNSEYEFRTSKMVFRTTSSASVLGVPTTTTNDKMTILGNGNVGIGTTTPLAKLQVIDNVSSGQPTLYVYKPSDLGETALVVVHSSNSSTRGIADFHNSSGSVMIINAAGRVGIGVTVPSESLEVDGNIKLANGAQRNIYGPTNQTLGIFSNPNGTNEGIKFSTDDGVTTEVFIRNGGNVGIGTEVPDTKLQVEENNTSYAATINNINDGGQGLYVSAGNGGVGVNSILSLADNTNAVKVTVLESGNVGIGVVSPTYKLQVHDNSTNYAAIIKNDNSNGEGLLIAAANGGTGQNSILTLSDSSFNEKVSVIENGNVGIGTTSPSEKLEVNGNIRLSVNSTIYSQGEFLTLMAGGTGGTAITIDDLAGHVGILNSSPSYNLDVDGTGRFTSTLQVDGDATFTQGVDITKTLTVGGIATFNNIVECTQFVNITKDLTVSGFVDINNYIRKKSNTSDYIGWKSNGEFIVAGAGIENLFVGNTLTELKYSGSTKLSTTNTGVTITGTATATNFILSSDAALKNNIKKVIPKEVKADWKTFELKSEPNQNRYGVIAQELEVEHPEFVRTNDDGVKSVAYIDLLIAKIAELEARLEKAGI